MMAKVKILLAGENVEGRVIAPPARTEVIRTMYRAEKQARPVAAGAVGVGRRSEVEAAAAAIAAATVAVALVVPTRSTNAVAKGAVGGIEIPLRSQLLCGGGLDCMHASACLL